MIKVLIVTSELHGGSAYWVAQLTKILSTEGVAVSVAFHPNGRQLEGDVAEVAGIVRLNFHFKLRGLLGNIRTLRAAIRESSPDIVYTNTVFPLVAVAATKVIWGFPKGTRLVHVLHSLFMDHFRYPFARRCASWIESTIGRLVDSVIAPSAYMASQGCRHYSSDKIFLIRNSLSQEQEEKLKATRAARLKRRAGLPYRILFVGRADRQKGLDLLVAAFRDLRTRLDVRLDLIGVSHAELVALLGPQLGVTPNVFCLGWVSDTAEVYRNADVFVMPSRWEAFGLTLLEARMAGVPCVGTRVDAIPELIPLDAGLVVEPEDSLSLAAAIHKTLVDVDLCSERPINDLPLYDEHKRLQLKLVEILGCS